MKRAAISGGLAMETSTTIVPASSQAVLDRESLSGWTGVTAEAADQSQHTASDPSVSVAAGSDETAPEPFTLQHQQVRDKAHLEKLRSSALPDAAIAKLQWRSLRDGRLEIDYLQPDGQPETCSDGTAFRRHRSTAAAIANGTPKYLSPEANGCRIYHSHAAIAAGNYSARLNDRNIPLRITEGELKAEAATYHDPARVTIALGGVSSWQDRRKGGTESEPLPELQQVPLKGRQVRLCFDSDYDKPQVAIALQRLADWLAGQGAHVVIEVLPNGLDAERLGLDDLIYRHGPEVFRAIAVIARCPFKERRKDGQTVLDWAFTPEPQNTGERNTYLAGMLGDQWRRSPDGKDHWQRWTGTHWTRVAGDDELAAEVERFADLQGWQNRELPVMRSLQAAFRRRIRPAADNGARGLLPFLNGCLVLDDLRLISHDPANGNTWALPYDYNPAATCPGVQEFLLDRLGDASAVALVRAFARGLLAGERLKCFLEFTGPGNTGKTVMENLLVALVGSGNAAACTLQRIEDRAQRFETLKLKGQRLAVFSECQDYSGQLQVLKALTGGDPIGAEIKGGRHLDFTFTGGVVLVGNGPIRASDPSGAVINRRRSLPLLKVVASADERTMLEADGAGNWRGELAAELPGFVNWALAMPAAEARAALARDVCSPARAEAEMDALLATDLLADWADQRLIWEPSWPLDQSLPVGMADGNPDAYLFPSYLRFVEGQGKNARPLSLKFFKLKLVDMLRDTLGLPLPAGSITSGDYRNRGTGSVVPCLRWRRAGEPMDIANGVIRHAFLARIGERVGTDAERVVHGKAPIGNGWNGCNGSELLSHKVKTGQDVFLYRGEGERSPVSSVPSVPTSRSRRSASVPAAGRSVPVEVLNPKTGQWEPGWQQISMGSGSGRFLCSDPAGDSRQVERKRIRRPV
jgi:phage/plasmid-associated DNA primase